MNRPSFLASLAAAFGALPFVKAKPQTDWERIVEVAEANDETAFVQNGILRMSSIYAGSVPNAGAIVGLANYDGSELKIARKWSSTKREGYMPEPFYGGYVESDALFKERLAKEMRGLS